MSLQTHNIKLEGSKNWNVWKFQIGIILRSKGVWDIVTGGCTKPAESEANASKKIQEWVQRDSMAQEIIATSMTEGPMSHLLTCTTSEQMWKKLLAVYEQKSEVNLHLLQQRFFSCKYEGEGVSMFTSKLEDLRNQLKNMGEEISEQMLITKILMSMPDDFKHFISAWESVSANEQKLNNLISRLLIEEERLKSSEKPEPDTALFAKNKNSNVKCFSCNKFGHFKRDCFKNKGENKGSSENQNKPVCYCCKKPGHFIKDCRYNKKGFKGKSGEDRKNEKAESNAFISSAFTGVACDKTEWYLDSGASEHMCCNRDMFTSLTTLNEPKLIKIGDGSTIKAVGIGNVELLAHNGKASIPTELKNVLYVPELTLNLFSTGTALDKGYVQHSDDKICKFVNKGGDTCAVAQREGKLYKMCFKPKERLEANVCKIDKDNIKKWHEKLSHQHIRQVKMILKKHNVEFKDEENFFCEDCAQGKQHRLPFNKSMSKTTRPCEIIHVDVCGPMENESIGRSRYFLLLKDDFSHFRTVYFLKNKFEVKEKIKYFLKLAENDTGNKVKIIRSDNGTEAIEEEIKVLLDSLGIRHQRTVPYTPEQNGRAEREMRTIVEAARTMLISRKLDKRFWAEAVNTAVYTINRTGTSSVNGKTPYELWFNKKENLEEFKIFGDEVYVHTPKIKRKKWDNKSKKGLFMGYADNTKGYRIYFPNENKIEIARDVIFVPTTTVRNEMIQNHDSSSEERENTILVQENIEQEQESEIITSVPEKFGLRDRATIKKPERYEDFDTSFIAAAKLDEPTNYIQAMEDKNFLKWKEAMDKEIETLKQNNTWKIVDKPQHDQVIDNKWVYKIKRDSDGKEIQFKARVVAKGFQQRYSDIDLSEIYSPVAKLTTLRTLLAVANEFRLQIYQMDVVGAFLNGDIKEEVYMNLPEGYEQKGKVGKLNKSIYGLKRSPKYWNEKFNEFMEREKFSRSTNDYCLYTKFERNQNMYVLLYVDDLLLVGSDESQINDLKNSLTEAFKMKDLGCVKTYLGINIEQNIEEGVIKINQKPYLEEVLNRFGMQNCKPITTPIEANFQLDVLKQEKPENKEIETKCRKIIGCLMYAMIGSRPDLCTAVNFLSRFQSCANNELLKCLKRVLRYIKGTLEYKLVFKRSDGSNTLIGYADADWGGDVKDRKSTTGYVLKVFGNTVTWATRKQSSVALSSTEAEYVALSQCISEACWLRKMLEDLNISSNTNSVIIYEDNQSAIHLAKNPENNKRLKHIDIRYHFVRDKVNEGVIDLKYVDTEKQIADLFTKPLNKVMFEIFRECLRFVKEN